MNEKIKDYYYNKEIFKNKETKKFKALINQYKTNNIVAYYITIEILNKLNKKGIEYKPKLPEYIIKKLEPKSQDQCLKIHKNIDKIINNTNINDREVVKNILQEAGLIE